MDTAQELATYIKSSGLADVLPPASPRAEPGVSEAVDPTVTDAIGPEWADLVRLHRLIRHRRVLNVLEFGCGWSSLVMSHALARNGEEHGAFVRSELRRQDPFVLDSVDDMEPFIATARARVPEDLRQHVRFHFSPVGMTTFCGRICTMYDALPNVCPDLIYVDAPSQHAARGDVRGVTTAHPDRLPMAADLLALEHFLLPGTLIVVDGRAANARFLRANFQRAWHYGYEAEGDVHIFELKEPPLGRYSRRHLSWALGDAWLAAVEA